MSDQPVTREYDHQPAPGVQAHTREVTQTGNDSYRHAEDTSFEGPGGTHGTATQRTEVTVEHSGGGIDGTDGKKHHHHHHHHSDHHEHSESHSKGGLLSKIGKIFHSDKKQESGEGGDAAHLTKYEGRQDTNAAFNSPGHGYTATETTLAGTPALNTTIESESSTIVKQEIPSPKKGERAADQYAMEGTNANSSAANVQAVKTTEQTTTKTTATVVGHVVEEREIHSNISQRIQEAKRIEQQEEYLAGGVEKLRIGSLQRESSAPYVRNVEVHRQDVNIDVRQGTQTSDIAVGPYVVERPGAHLHTDATYKTATSALDTGPSVVENQPRPSNLISERVPTRQIDQGYVVESQAQQSGILNERMRTQDIIRGDSTVENFPQSSGVVSGKVATSDIASGPYVVVKPGQESGIVNESYRVIATGPSVVENQPQRSGLISEQYATSQFATGPSVIENAPQSSGLISERDRTRDVDQGYVLESQAQSSGLVSERVKTRDMDQGYVLESRGQESGLLSEKFKTRDRDTGPTVVENRPEQSYAVSERIATRDVDQGYIVENQAQQSNLLSERHATSDIAAGPYVLVKEGEHLNVDATSREAAAQFAGRDMYAANERLQSVGTATQKIENFEERTVERAPLQIVKEAPVVARVDQFEHEQMTNIVKTVPEITVRRSLEEVRSELMTESPVQKTLVPNLHADVLRKAQQLERDESVDTSLPEQIPIVKHAGISEVLEELRENSVTKVEKTSPPRLTTHVPERAHHLEAQRETVVTSSPVDIVKHASIGGVIEELRESAVTYVEKTPAPIIETHVPQRAAEFVHQQQDTVTVSKKPVVLGRRVDIEQIKESLTTTNKGEVMKSAEIPQVQSNVRESVNRYERFTPAEQEQQRGFQREVSARGDVLGQVDKFSTRTEDVVTSRNVVDVAERGTVREQKQKFESGAAFASENNSKTKLVVTSQPVEIAQIEVERTENIRSKDGSQNQTADAAKIGAKSLVREDVTVKMNKNLEGMRVVPEKVIVEKEQHVTRTETVTVNQQQQQQQSKSVSSSGSSSASARTTSAQPAAQISEVERESGSTTKTTIHTKKAEQH